MPHDDSSDRDSRPRVLFVAQGHPDRRRGGAEQCAHVLYRAVRDAGTHDAWIVAASGAAAHANTPWSTDPDDPHQLFLATGAYDHFWGRAHDRQGSSEAWRALLRLTRPDVVHFHHLESLGYDLIRHVRRERPDAGIVYTLHDYQPICAVNAMVRPGTGELCRRADPESCRGCVPDFSAGRHFLRRRWIRSNLDLVDRFIAPSRFLRDRYVDWGLPAARIQVLENPRGRPLVVVPEDHLVDRPPVRFGYFGQLSAVKGTLVLLRAARLLYHRGVPAEFAIHGANLELQPGEFREAVRRELLGCPPSVVVHPPYAPDDVHRLMQAVDWVVVPSTWWENSPLVIQEAFLNGRPVICSDIGGMAEKVRPGVDGLWFTAGDPAALAATLETAATSRPLWERLRRAAPKPPAPAEAAAAHTAIYHELCPSRGPVRGAEGRAS